MKKTTVRFSQAATTIYYESSFRKLKSISPPSHTVIITDENVFAAHQPLFEGWNIIVLKPGEEFKVQDTIDKIINTLIQMEVGRDTTLVGVGGGVITDLTGYVAAIYMRGLRFGFCPTSLLALVDASIGGKNGIDVGLHKNLVGVTRQPAFILHDVIFLRSLPQKEWINGFAEIIKHAAILSPDLFKALEKNELTGYQAGEKKLAKLVRVNAALKLQVVQQDEFEKNKRRLLNFGHTIGHALETQYELNHGEAVAIGMTYAAQLSALVTGFKGTQRLTTLLEKYHLPTYADFESEKVFALLKMDKKREGDCINFVLLEKIGRAKIESISLTVIEKFLSAI